MKFLQKIGKSMMIPIACMPICGILMGIGYLLCPAGMQGGEIIGVAEKIGYFLCKAGGAVIDHMPILFAIGTGIGMSDGEGMGGLAALVSWLMITTLLSGDIVSTIFSSVSGKETVMLALSKIENPFIGILSGLIGACCVNKCKNVRLPSWLSFFSGKRLGMIAAGLVSILASVLLAFIWPLLFTGLVFVGEKIQGLGYLGSAIYVTLNRLLLPFGLHHALNNVFWFDTIGLGDLTAFWAGKTSADVGWSLGMYMSGFFPSMMFGVPAAALAMYKSFKRKNKQATGMLFSASLTSILCGVTEPFEFMFMFVSPLLYVVYSVLYGAFTYIANVLGFRAGFSFSGGLIDLIFSSSLPAAQKTLLIIPLGIAAFAVYYFVFRLLIKKLDLKTPGREDEEERNDAVVSAGGAGTGNVETDRASGHGNAAPEGNSRKTENRETRRAAGIIEALGGKENIISVSNCATRLRIELKDNSVCNESAVKKAGAVALVKMGANAVQVIIGMEVEFVAEEIKNQLNNSSAENRTKLPGNSENETTFPGNSGNEMTLHGNSGNEMTLYGKTGNGGIAVGKIFLKKEAPIPERETVSDIEEELQKFEKSFLKVKDNLQNAIKTADPTTKDILEAQLMMLEDKAFSEKIKDKIKSGMNASYAAYETGNENAKALEEMEDDYLRARAFDMRDIGAKIYLEIMGVASSELLDEPCIYVTEELTPEQISKLDKTKILGIVTRKGSANSHTAILAGNYGLPYLFSVDFDREVMAKADSAVMDAKEGILILSPTDKVKKEYSEKMETEKEALLSSENYNGKIKVYANIGTPADVEDVLREGANGIGLFRTEFLYMNRETLPTEEEQFEAYKTVLEKMQGGEVVIRTMDIGADKKTECLKLSNEENPALGKRAIRICLENPELFRTQLRALLRAAAFGPLYIMYPMIASPEEIDDIQEQVKTAAKELDERNEKYRIPPQGIMIETPAAAMISDILAEKVDFFSIGTNDLTQYTIALDRQAEGMDRFYHPDHEAVLRLIALSVKNGHEKGIWVGICGEMGGNPEMIPKLYEMGIDELSMSPHKVKKAKSILMNVAGAKESTGNLSVSAEEKEEPSVKSESPIGSISVPANEKEALPEEFGSPCDGALVPMEEIPDEAFSSGVLGKCMGAIPENGNIYSPCDGTITMIADTLHAIGIKTPGGREVLVHVGLDTVTLQGKGFDCKVKIGDSVTKETLLLTADLTAIEEAGLNTMVIVAVNGL